MYKLLFLIKKLLYSRFKKNFFLKKENIVCFICGNEALPLPLDDEEEQVLILQAETGDEQSATAY